MEKQTFQQLKEVLEGGNINLRFCTATNQLYNGENKLPTSRLQFIPCYGDIKKALCGEGTITDKKIAINLVDYCNISHSTFNTLKEKAEEKARKEQEKAEEKARKEQEKAEEKARKEQEKAEEKARKAELKSNILEEVDKDTLDEVHKQGYYLFNEKIGDWRDYLVYDPMKLELSSGVTVKVRKREPKDYAYNYEMYFEHSPRYGGRLRYNDWTRRQELDEGYIEEATLRGFYADIENDLGFTSRSKVDDAYYRVCQSHRIHPLQDYLRNKANEWDGTERVATLFIDKLKADDTELTREMTRRWFLGAVKRVFKAGCKNEVMLILVGCQGDGKSTLMEKLFGRWGIELNVDISKEQDYGMKLDGAWCIMEDELANWSKKEAGAYKKWLSILRDNFRLPFEHKILPHYRHCCYCGATNEKYFLKDYSDNCERRYWIIQCHGTKDESWDMVDTLTPEFIDQIWAEVAHYYFDDEDVAIDIKGEYTNQLEALQREYKTSNEDNVSDELEEILNRKYKLDDEGQFDDLNDCLNQVQFGAGYVPELSTNGHLKKLGYIRFIPSSYVKMILKTVLKDNRKHNYFEYTLKDKWRVNRTERVNGVLIKGYKRIGNLPNEEGSLSFED